MQGNRFVTLSITENGAFINILANGGVTHVALKAISGFHCQFIKEASL